MIRTAADTANGQHVASAAPPDEYDTSRTLYVRLKTQPVWDKDEPDEITKVSNAFRDGKGSWFYVPAKLIGREVSCVKRGEEWYWKAGKALAPQPAQP